jgi:phosphoglycolate phosphatase
MVRGLLFDLDGTLLDTGADLAAACNAVRQSLNMVPLEPERLIQFVGKGADRLVHRCLVDALEGDAPSDLFRQARQAFDVHYARLNGHHTQVYPGVVEALSAFQKQGLRLACVTNKPEAFTHPLLQRFGLREFFNPIVGGDTYPVRKPDPMALLAVAAAWGLPAAQCVMVGDSDNDVLAARRAGMAVWAVPYGYNEGRPIALSGPDGIVERLDQLSAVLGTASITT